MKSGAIAAVVCVALLLAAGGGCDSQGTLICPAGAVLCGTQCSNLQGDPDNCGACGTVCAHGAICDLAVCTSAGFDAGQAVEGAAPAPPDAASDVMTMAMADTGAPIDAGLEGQ